MSLRNAAPTAAMSPSAAAKGGGDEAHSSVRNGLRAAATVAGMRQRNSDGDSHDSRHDAVLEDEAAEGGERKKGGGPRDSSERRRTKKGGEAVVPETEIDNVDGVVMLASNTAAVAMLGGQSMMFESDQLFEADPDEEPHEPYEPEPEVELKVNVVAMEHKEEEQEPDLVPSEAPANIVPSEAPASTNNTPANTKRRKAKNGKSKKRQISEEEHDRLRKQLEKGRKTSLATRRAKAAVRAAAKAEAIRRGEWIKPTPTHKYVPQPLLVSKQIAVTGWAPARAGPL